MRLGLTYTLLLATVPTIAYFPIPAYRSGSLPTSFLKDWNCNPDLEWLHGVGEG